MRLHDMAGQHAEAEAVAERIVALDPEMEIALADTTGNASPDQVGRVFRHAIAHWGDRFAFHGHDTYGMGVANVSAAWEAGCRVFDSAAGGIGGCPFIPAAAGNIATEVAKRAAGFGMKVIAFDPFIKNHPDAEMVGSLDELVAKADVISLHTPLTDETRGMVNAASHLVTLEEVK